MDRRPAAVRETYDEIAEHFSSTREHAWPEIETFLADRRGGVGLDVGCGNGRHTELLAAVCERTVGVDLSRGLLECASERRASADRFGLCQGDAAGLPVRDDVVDLAVYVATVHHLPDPDARIASLSELARVLAPGGRALVSAWATEHDRFDRETGFDTTVDWTLPDGRIVPRFYHIYDPAEFRADLDASALSVREAWVASGNCFARVGP